MKKLSGKYFVSMFIVGALMVVSVSVYGAAGRNKAAGNTQCVNTGICAVTGAECPEECQLDCVNRADCGMANGGCGMAQQNPGCGMGGGRIASSCPRK